MKVDRLNIFSAFMGIFFLLTASSAFAAEKILYTIYGETSDDAGHKVVGLGDVNGDGYSDFAVSYLGASPAGQFSGKVIVYSGKNGQIIHEKNGTEASEKFGSALANAGDVNNDGINDFIVGSPEKNNAAVSDNNEGLVQVFSGSSGNLIHAFFGGTAQKQFGTTVAGGGDINNDGFDDFMVGEYRFGVASTVRVYSGQPGIAQVDALLRTYQGDLDFFGSAIAIIGDVDNDGIHDILIGEKAKSFDGTYPGKVYVYSGADSTPATALNVFTGAVANQKLGSDLSAAGDINDDGVSDFLMAAEGNFLGISDKVYAISGADFSTLYFLDNSGSKVSYAGDINVDGYDDFMIGDYYSNGGLLNGSVFVYSGADGDLIASISGPAAGSEFGRSLNAVGDVNKNGFPDIIIGAPRDNSSGSTTGSSWVYELNPCKAKKRSLNFMLQAMCL